MKRGPFEYIQNEKVDLAFELLKDGKIGPKKTWVLSGLISRDFLDEWKNWMKVL